MVSDARRERFERSPMIPLPQIEQPEVERIVLFLGSAMESSREAAPCPCCLAGRIVDFAAQVFPRQLLIFGKLGRRFQGRARFVKSPKRNVGQCQIIVHLEIPGIVFHPSSEERPRGFKKLGSRQFHPTCEHHVDRQVSAHQQFSQSGLRLVRASLRDHAIRRRRERARVLLLRVRQHHSPCRHECLGERLFHDLGMSIDVPRRTCQIVGIQTGQEMLAGVFI